MEDKEKEYGYEDEARRNKKQRKLHKELEEWLDSKNMTVSEALDLLRSEIFMLEFRLTKSLLLAAKALEIGELLKKKLGLE